MTEYELDRWYGHQVGIDISNFPPYRPTHVNKQAYEYLKKYASFNQQESAAATQQQNEEGAAGNGGQAKFEGRIRKIRPKENLKNKDLDEKGENLSMINNRSKDQ